MTVGLFHKKANLGARRPALGYAITFGEARTTVVPADLAEVESLAPRLPVGHRIRHALSTGAKTIAELAEALDAKPNTIQQAISRSRGQIIRFVKTEDGIHRYGLAPRGGQS